jgi:hypothetical protein
LGWVHGRRVASAARRTNITKFDQPKGDEHYRTPMPSGLLGPVRLEWMNAPAQ